MPLFLKTLPLLAALVAAPVLAADADPHADHNAAPAATEAKAPMQGCPMMTGAMAKTDAGKAPGPMARGKAMGKPEGKAGGEMMMGKDGMHCMMMDHAAATPQTQPPASGAAPEHDHDHPDK